MACCYHPTVPEKGFCGHVECDDIETFVKTLKRPDKALVVKSIRPGKLFVSVCADDVDTISKYTNQPAEDRFMSAPAQIGIDSNSKGNRPDRDDLKLIYSIMTRLNENGSIDIPSIQILYSPEGYIVVSLNPIRTQFVHAYTSYKDYSIASAFLKGIISRQVIH